MNYTVQRINKRDEFYGKVHGSHDANRTLCGLVVEYGWYILTNDGKGEVTCPKCCKVADGH